MAGSRSDFCQAIMFQSNEPDLCGKEDLYYCPLGAHRDKNIMINVGKSRGGLYVNGCGGAVHSKGVHFISI